MSKPGRGTVSTILAGTLAGCGATTVKPNSTTTHTDLIRIGGDAPEPRSRKF